ncbi:MAG: glycosyltransferase family 4 protein [Chloroflexi bacterium]|nr:glycosyltransferase family 4 protein [Chloroflexota bacterium]
MKIGLVSPYDYSYPGGVTIHVSQLARQFQARGHTVKVVAPCSKPPADDLRECVIPVGHHPVPVPSGGSIARITLSLKLSGTVRRLLQKEDFDVVHMHEPFTPMLPVTFLRLSDYLNIATFHAYHSKPRGYGLAKFILRKWVRRLHGRVAVSEPARKFVARHFPGDYRIIPNGIDLGQFSPLVEPMDCLGDGKLNIVFVGRLEKRKGLDYLLKAFVLLKKDYPEARLVVVGPGKSLLNRYRRVIQRQDIKDVVFTGYVPYNELPRYYRSAHVFCAPALGEESFGIVLLESMACGRAVVASNIEGYASLMTHGEEGLLVPPRNELALRDALGELLADRTLREEMGYRGSLKAGDYSWDKVGARVLDYYHEVAGNYPWVATNAGQLVSSLQSSGSD